MGRRRRRLLWICLIGLVVTLALAGGTTLLRQRALAQTETTFYAPLDGTVEWEGDWEFSERGADPAGEATAERATILFEGTGLTLRVRRGDYRGYFFITIDGQPANRLPREGDHGYLVLTSPDRTQRVDDVLVASDLPDGPHEAHLVAERGWMQWPLVGWTVRRGPDTTPYRWATTGLLALAMVCLAGTVVWGLAPGFQVAEKKAHWTRRIWNRLRKVRSGIAQATERVPLPFSIDLEKGRGVGVLIVAALAFYFSPWDGLSIASGLVLAALILLRLDLGLALVAATAPFFLYPRPLFGKAFSMAEIATLLCALSWGMRQLMAWRGKGERARKMVSSLVLRSSEIDRAVFFFVLVAVASFLVADFRHVALRELRVLILEPALFYLILRTSPLRKRAIWRLVDFFLLGALIVAGIGLVQYALGVNVITAEGGFARLRSVYGSPNSVGLYLGRALPVLIAVALWGGTRRRRLAYALLILPIAAAILLSFSKGAILIGVPITLLALGIFGGGRWTWGALGVLLLGVVAAIPLFRTPRFAALLDASSGTIFFRLQIWRASLRMFADHPWLGVGPDNFLYLYRGRYILPAAWQEPGIAQAHNIVLDYATRMGIPGLIAGVWLQVAFWRTALPLLRVKNEIADRDIAALSLGLMGLMVDFLAHGLVDASYFLIDLAFVFFLTLGVVQWVARRQFDGN